MEAHFTEKKHRTGDIWSFSFTPAQHLSWQAGQSLRLEIPGPYGPLEHRFSIASAPSTGIITVTTRLSGSDYKESLARLQPGDLVQLYAVEGEFTWTKHTKHPILVAGGIGITPFYAMLAEREALHLPLAATLLYRSTNEPPLYAHELIAWQARGLTVQRLPHRPTAADVLHLPHAKNRTIYISGPSKMVAALYDDLLAANIAPATILRDQFTGRLPLDG